VTQRRESDTVHILSGVFEGKTLGTPICLLVWNEDARPEAYEHFKELYRPSHADYTYDTKYGSRDWRGGGRASARETVGRVAAGAIAKKILHEQGVQIVGWVEKIHTLCAQVDPDTVTLEQVEATPVRCPDPAVAEAMAQAIDQARRQGDSLGGVVGCVARGVPPGWGEPVFDKLDADLAKAMLSIPAAKGFEIGSGFAGTELTGSQHNDPFYVDERGNIRTRSNRSGGIQGGISNGENIVIRVAFKPTATIMMPQETVNIHREPAVLKAKGRHDPCVLPRAVPIVEAMMALVLVDHYLRHRAQCGG
jgi:chorismate synthase